MPGQPPDDLQPDPLHLLQRFPAGAVGDEGGVPMTGLTLWLFKNPQFAACSLGGISSLVEQVTLIGHGPAEPTERAPAVALVEKEDGYKFLVPADVNGAPLPGWWMHGGTYAGSVDSRFWVLSRYPLPLHDRALAREHNPRC